MLPCVRFQIVLENAYRFYNKSLTPVRPFKQRLLVRCLDGSTRSAIFRFRPGLSRFGCVCSGAVWLRALRAPQLPLSSLAPAFLTLHYCLNQPMPRVLVVDSAGTSART